MSGDSRNSVLLTRLAAGAMCLTNIALVYTQLAFFPIFSDVADAYFHSLIFFAPFAAAALYLSLPVYVGCAGALSIALVLHATYQPIDYYEMMMASVPVALLFTVLGALVIWGVMRMGMSLWQRRTRATTRARGLFLVGSLLVASLVISSVIYPLAIVMDGWAWLDESYSALDLVAGALSMTSPVFQTLFDWLVFCLFAIPFDALAQRMLRGQLRRTLRAVFQRWLLVVVSAAFLVTNTIGYCMATKTATDAARGMLSSQVRYLCDQVRDHAEQLETLKQAESELVLSKARAAMQLISTDDTYGFGQQDLVQLCDVLGVESITVCDAQGTVVADSDGQGINTFNFGDNENTAKYLNLIGSQVPFIIEPPRNSITVDGTSSVVRVFAGVSMPQNNGFVQVSVDAAEYADSLDDVAVEKLADNYTFGDNGKVIIAHNDNIVSTNDKNLEEQTLEELFLPDGFDMEGFDYQALIDSYLMGEFTTLRDSDTMGVLYQLGERVGDYAVICMIDADSVFASRRSSIILNSMVYLVLFAVVYLLAAVLLDNVVVQGFNRTNDVLALITQGDLDQRIDEHETVEFDSLSAGINSTVGALKDSIAEVEARFEHDLTTAKAIQESALPSAFPPFPEIDAFDIYASMNAAREVGGDFYDFFLIDEHTLGFLIADVSGKGIPASLFMMEAKSEIGNYMMTGMPLCDAIQSANHHLCQGNDAGMFVTVWAATLNWDTGKLTYVNAGHNPPLLRHGIGGQWEWLKKKCGLFLGTFERAKYRQATLQLKAGDELLLYTDGVNEAFSVDEEEYGNERLEAFLAAHTNLHPQGMVDALRADVSAWAAGAEQSDDITMLCLEYGMAPEACGEITVPATLDQLAAVEHMIHEELGQRLCPIGAQNKIDIALEELFVNVCRYAYANQPEPGQVTVSYVYTPDPCGITIQIVDEGVPFDPLRQQNPTTPQRIEDISVGGLGIMMTKRSVDDLTYSRDGSYNRVAFTKRW